MAAKKIRCNLTTFGLCTFGQNFKSPEITCVDKNHDFNQNYSTLHDTNTFLIIYFIKIKLDRFRTIALL